MKKEEIAYYSKNTEMYFVLVKKAIISISEQEFNTLAQKLELEIISEDDCYINYGLNK